MGKRKKRKRLATQEISVRNRSLFREIFETGLYGIILLVFCRGFVWANFNIPTKSMENSLLIGDHLLANNFIFRPTGTLDWAILPTRKVARGDVVILKSVTDGKTPLVKRCVGLPGDRFYMHNDKIYLDGEYLREPYTYFKNPFLAGKSDRDPKIGYRPLGYYEARPGLEQAQYLAGKGSLTMVNLRARTKKSLEPYRKLNPDIYEQILARLDRGEPECIPAGFYVMLGDNRNLSEDSRSFGLVPQEFILGKPHFVWWSYGEDEDSHKLTGLDLVWSYLRVPLTIWTRTHWQESMRLIR